MNWSLSLEPLLSWPWLAAVLVPVLLIALAGLWLRQRGALFRLGAVAALALAMLNPVLLDDSPERREVEAAGWEVAYDGMDLDV